MLPAMPMGTLDRATIGAAAGIGATAAMSGFMLLAQRIGLLQRLPPLELTSKSIERSGLGDEVGPEAHGDLGWLAHYAFGAAGGGLFAVARHRLRTPGPTVGHGIAFGLLVWLVSYAGWIPALRLLPPPTEDEPGRPAGMILAHVVYGASLALVLDAAHRAQR